MAEIANSRLSAAFSFGRISWATSGIGRAIGVRQKRRDRPISDSRFNFLTKTKAPFLSLHDQALVKEPGTNNGVRIYVAEGPPVHG
jgi:hypothetical protein